MTQNKLTEQSDAMRGYMGLRIKLERQYSAGEITAGDFFEADLRARMRALPGLNERELCAFRDDVDRLYTIASRTAARRGLSASANSLFRSN